MRKFIYAALAALFILPALASGQDLLRFNYQKNGYTFTGSERIRVEGTNPLYVQLQKITFPDKGVVFEMRVDVEDSEAWKMPKNAPLTVSTTAGKTVILKNSADQPNLVAPKGIKKGNSRVWLNYGEYYFEKADLEKMLSGVSKIEVTRRWSSSGVIDIVYKDNEFGKALSSAFEAVNGAKTTKIQGSSDNLQSVSDLNGNRIITSKRFSVSAQNKTGITQDMEVGLNYLYYADSNKESYDLYLFPDGVSVPDGGAIVFTLNSGEEIALKQEQKLPEGRVLVYPTIEQLKRLMGGVRGISMQTSTRERSYVFSADNFSDRLSTLYQSIMTAAIL